MMSGNLEKGLIEAGYFLSRMGVGNPPEVLQATSWKEAYAKFYSAFGMGKTESEFKNSLKNLRDHFDSHLDNNRIGWKNSAGNPQQLSSVNQRVFDELQMLDDAALWDRIKPCVVTSYDAALSRRKIKANYSKKAKFFSSEFKGRKVLKERKTSEAIVTHGFVVDCLKAYVDRKVSGCFTYNTQKIDLALELNGELSSIYEVKTSTDTQSIYTAVGQLYMHSADVPGLQKWIVLPGPIDNDELFKCFDSLGISLLCYRMRNETYQFKHCHSPEKNEDEYEDLFCETKACYW